MPLYTYQCAQCDHRFEVRQHFSDEPLLECPKCKEKALRKVYLPVSIVFKGDGWYVTDKNVSHE